MPGIIRKKPAKKRAERGVVSLEDFRLREVQHDPKGIHPREVESMAAELLQVRATLRYLSEEELPKVMMLVGKLNIMVRAMLRGN